MLCQDKYPKITKRGSINGKLAAFQAVAMGSSPIHRNLNKVYNLYASNSKCSYP